MSQEAPRGTARAPSRPPSCRDIPRNRVGGAVGWAWDAAGLGLGPVGWAGAAALGLGWAVGWAWDGLAGPAGWACGLGLWAGPVGWAWGC